MTLFAEIVNDKVIRVIVSTQKEINKNYSGTWIETKMDHSIRKQYAGIGMSFDSVKNKFIREPDYPSWVLDSNDDWKSPKVKPDGKFKWNENALDWEPHDGV